MPKPLKAALDTTPQQRGRTGPQGPAGPTGPAGPSGAQGEKGEPGVPGQDHATEIAALRAQVDLLARELQTQLTRIGQLQAQLDRVESARAAEPKDDRSADHAEH